MPLRLDEVINGSLIGLAGLIGEVTLQNVVTDQVQRGMMGISDKPDDLVSEAMKERLRGWIVKIGSSVADEYEMPRVEARIKRFSEKIEKTDFDNRQLHHEIQALHEALQDDVKWQAIYRYSNEQRKVLFAWRDDWKAVLQTFPEVQADIIAAVDLWALSHPTASVFHLMRVLEHGLSALANDLGVQADGKVWGVILNEIEKAIKVEMDMPGRAKRTGRLQYLSEAAKEFSYFKDGWRNYVSHNKAVYDVHQARNVMEHVRNFMTTLAKNLASAKQSGNRS